MFEDTYFRGWKYKTCGDYHRNLDLNWSYALSYIKKIDFIRRFIEKLPHNTRILDAGCGEGVLVEEFSSKGYSIVGFDLNYESKYVRRGNILAMPYQNDSFDIVLLLDILEHLSFENQPEVLKEIKRVLLNNGKLVVSLPNLAHLESRYCFFLKGILDRTASEIEHPGERPIWENIKLLKDAGFKIVAVKGITLTVPIVYRRIICKKPKRFKWLHDLLNNFAIPSLAKYNIIISENKK